MNMSVLMIGGDTGSIEFLPRADLPGLVDVRVSVEQENLERSQILTGLCSRHRRSRLGLHPLFARHDKVKQAMIGPRAFNKTF